MIAIDYMNVSPIVPVVVLDNSKDALPLADALLEGGIGIMEITLRSEAALASIEQIARDRPEMHVGAGTVINSDQLFQVRDHGGKFSFSPGISTSLLADSRKHGIPFIPGVATASEVMLAIDHGVLACKLFPATAVGGVKTLKGLSGPFPQVSFCPTGGVSLDNMNEFLSLPNVKCVGGSWIVPAKLVNAGDFASIVQLCKSAIEHIDT